MDVSETNTNKTPTTNLKKNGKPYSLRSSILKSATKHNVSEVGGNRQCLTCEN